MATSGTRVGIDLNVPPVALPGFGSNVSIWLGPPFIQRRMQAFAFGGRPWAKAARGSSHCANSRLNRPPMPTLRKPRRLMEVVHRSTGPGQQPPNSSRVRRSSISSSSSHSRLLGSKGIIITRSHFLSQISALVGVGLHSPRGICHPFPLFKIAQVYLPILDL